LGKICACHGASSEKTRPVREARNVAQPRLDVNVKFRL
jgi:hypothetical protein